MMNMPYLYTPRWAAITLRAIQVMQYALILGGGVYTAFHASPALDSEFGRPALVVASVLMALFAIPALYGVIRGLYRYEWVSVWFIASGIGCYATATWSHSFDNPGSTLAAINLTIAFLFFAARAIHLTVVAQRARAGRRFLG